MCIAAKRLDRATLARPRIAPFVNALLRSF
jgi:hypothetical protein